MSNSLLRRLALPAVIAALAIPALAACNSAGANESTGKEAADSATEVKVGETSLGDVLLDSEGKTLYMFKKDKDGKSACYDKCEKTWPPLTVDGDAKAGDGADADLLGTSEREDGSQQVTYNGMPLYYFAKDKAEGDVNGQGVKEVWYVVDAEGNIVDKAKDSGGDDGYDDGEEKKSYDLELVDNADYGPILVNSEGMTLYMFFKDEKLDNASACYKDCLNKWTPLTVEDDPTYGDGVDKSLIGTIEREDGTKQVTYNDWPMYTFNDDANAGDTKGVGFKDLWCATTATGEAAVTK